MEVWVRGRSVSSKVSGWWSVVKCLLYSLRVIYCHLKGKIKRRHYIPPSIHEALFKTVSLPIEEKGCFRTKNVDVRNSKSR